MSTMKHPSAWLDRVTRIVGITTTLGMASRSAVSWIVDALIKSAGMNIQDASLMATVELVTMGATFTVKGTTPGCDPSSRPTSPVAVAFPTEIIACTQSS